MSIVQTVIGAIASSGGGAPTPYYYVEITGNQDEGSNNVGLVVHYENANGQTVYWSIINSTVTEGVDYTSNNGYSGNFNPTGTGQSTVATLTFVADATTEGNEYFQFRIGTSPGGNELSAVGGTIVDTSLTPPLQPPFSLGFNGSSSYLGVQNTQSDWALNRTWTIEFWSKANTASSGGNLLSVMCQDYGDGNSIQILYQNGFQIKGGTTLAAEPTPGVWTHVALVSTVGDGVTLYYNGVSQSTGGYYSLNNSSADLAIGKRAPGNFQYFNGKLAMIRVSTTAKYLDNFSPSLSYGREADTRMMLGSDNPLTDLALYVLNGIATSNSDGGTLYFSKATYPDLNNQVRSGDTVVDTANNQTSTLTGAVFTADPDNWGVNVSSLQTAGTKNFSGPGRHPIDNQGAVISMDFPSFQSLEFNQPQGDFLSTPASNDWNLGNNWTMEFWIKSNNNSASNINIPGGQWGLINQGGWYGGMPDDNCILVGMTGGRLTINQSATSAINFAEPTTQVWTHVAIVNNGGGSAQKVYYNGVEQTALEGGYTSNGKTNTTADLYIGRLSNQYAGYASHFDGKMAMVRISDSAKYLTAFTATTTYNFETGTKLFLSKFTPTIDTAQHTITNNGVTTSTDFPQSFIGHLNPYSGGTLGATYIQFGDPNITAFAAIPVGARITSNLSGFGIRQVTSVGNYYEGLQITYDNTGLPGGIISTTSDTYNFYW